MIRICVARFPVDYDVHESAEDRYYQEWKKTELGRWVTVHSNKITMYFGVSQAGFSHSLEYVAEFTEQNYCILQLKYGNDLPKDVPSWA